MKRTSHRRGPHRWRGLHRLKRTLHRWRGLHRRSHRRGHHTNEEDYTEEDIPKIKRTTQKRTAVLVITQMKKTSQRRGSHRRRDHTEEDIPPMDQR